MLLDVVEQYDAEKIALFRGVWESTLLHLGQQQDHKKILSFLCRVGILDLDEKDKMVIFGVPNEFILTQVRKFFSKALKESINEVYNPHFSVKFVIYSKFSGTSELLIDLKKLLHIKETKASEFSAEKKTIKTELSHFFGILFDPKFTFDSFVVGATNNIAFSAAKAVTAKPGQAYNPLFLYGSVGLGKTHLMQAIGNDIMQRYPDKVVVYLPTSKLIDEIVTAIKANKLTNVLKKFEDVDVLLIDDVQFLADKDKTQEIFHNIFNDFQLRQKQIIISSDRPPKELVHIEPRLKSRFALGLVADIKSPDFETRIAILQSKLMNKGEDLDFHLLEIIAKYIKENVRELEGALNILLSRKAISHKDVEEKDVYECLKTLGYKVEHTAEATEIAVQSNTKGTKNYDLLVDMVAQYYGLSVQELKSESRKKEITNARQLLMLLAKKYFSRTLERIGDHFGGKGHAAVIYAINNTEKKIKKDQDLAHDYEVFVDRLGK
ncbi:MAG: chromosomal replication initiator protein DnaA [candidate division SR1 bacterium]|nr:chromosomal replication initiator protein DnaA [candidate division SR1 bacterium]